MSSIPERLEMIEGPLAVILTGGRAKRLQPLSLELPKAIIPVLNQPLITYTFERLAETDIKEVFIVVTPHDRLTGKISRESVPAGMSIKVVVQPIPNGPAGALAHVPNNSIRRRHVAVIAADSLLYGGDIRGQFGSWLNEPVDAWLPLAPTKTPTSMGIAQLVGERIVEFVEKPKRPKGNLASPAWWLLGPEAIDRVLDDAVVNTKGELEISGTLSVMIEEGYSIGGRCFDGEWYDTGTLAALLSTQERLLQEKDISVLIAPDAIVEDCQLGPNVVVGSGCRLRDVTLSDALIAPGAVIHGLKDSQIIVTPSGIIGRP